MSITQEEMKNPTSKAEMVNPFDSKYEMSDKEMAKVFAQNEEKGEPDSEEILTKVTDDQIPTEREKQDELLREYVDVVILSSASRNHHYLVDAANYIVTDNSFAHEDALSVLKTLNNYFKNKYVRH